MLDTKKTLAANLSALLETRNTSRLDLSRQIKVADGSLGRIKYGTGNPTIETIEGIARFFRLEAWQLLAPDLGKALMETKPQPTGEKPRIQRRLINVPSPRDRPKLAGGAARSARIVTTSNFDQAVEKAVAKIVEDAIQRAVREERIRWESEHRKAG